MIKQLAREHFFGRRRYQRLWEKLYHWSLAGMNVGISSTLDPGELWVLDHIRDELAHHATKIVCDVGANTGAYSLEVLRRFGNTARIHCFEPAQEPYRVLCDVLGQYENVECLNFGLGDTDESRALFTYAGQSGLSSVYDRLALRSGNGSQTKREEQIHLKTLDSFSETKGISHISLLKVDVEGHELKVLQGARRLIEQGSIDFIQFEFGGTDIDSRTFMNDFRELLDPHFEIFRILKDGLSPIKSFKGTHEIFAYSNFLAVSRELR